MFVINHPLASYQLGVSKIARTQLNGPIKMLDVLLVQYQEFVLYSGAVPLAHDNLFTWVTFTNNWN